MSEAAWIKVDDSKLKVMKAAVWSKYEEPLLAITADYCPEEKKKFRSGGIMITRGAIYFFKNKLFKGFIFAFKLHLLDVRRISVSQDFVSFELDDKNINIKSKDAVKIVTTVQDIMQIMAYGLSNLRTFEISSSIPIPPSSITSREEHAIKWRSLFLAHFYDIKGDQLYTVDYFDKWEFKKNEMMVLGQSFHPGNFAPAFGHSIGWEVLVKTVAFQAFAPSKFARLLEALLENAQTIQRIAFTDFKADKLPVFPQANIKKTNIKEWWFMRAPAQLIIDFAAFASFLPKEIEEVLIEKTTFTKEEFAALADNIVSSEAFGQTKRLSLMTISMRAVDKEPIKKIISSMPKLESVTIQALDISAVVCLSYICRYCPNIKTINLSHMQFRTSIDVQSIQMPAKLTELNVSNDAFSPESLKSLLAWLTMTPKSLPIVFTAQTLTLKPAAYSALAELDPEMLNSNICEFDWSGNLIPAEPSVYLFSFLFSQKRLRLLKLNEASAEDPTTLMKHVVQLAESLQMPGLEFSGRFQSTLFAQFISALAARAPALRHVSLKGNLTGNEGAASLLQLVQELTMISSLCIDGTDMNDPMTAFNLWSSIANNDNIIACDFPITDIKKMGIDITKISEQARSVFDKLWAKKVPSTTENRVELMLSKVAEIDADESLDQETISSRYHSLASPDIFTPAAQTRTGDIEDAMKTTE